MFFSRLDSLGTPSPASNKTHRLGRVSNIKRFGGGFFFFGLFFLSGFNAVFSEGPDVSVPLPTASGSTAASRSWGSAAGHTSPGLWVCGAACTCCRAPPRLWPRDQCCCRRRSASSGHGRRSWSTEGGRAGEGGGARGGEKGKSWTQRLIND